MITKFQIFEGIHWWKDGKLGAEEPDNLPEYNDILPDNGFRQFLLDNDCYEEYLKELENQDSIKCVNDFRKYSRRSWLNYCLSWDQTEKGYEYWSKKNHLWNTVYFNYPPDMNEGIHWWKDGKLGEEESNEPDELDKFKIGDVMRNIDKVFYWDDMKYKPNKTSNKWTTSKQSLSQGYIVTDVSECTDIYGYTGQIIKIKNRWPWYQTTNFEKIGIFNEGVRWWKDGKLGPEEEDEPFDEKTTNFEVGDTVTVSDYIYYWNSGYGITPNIKEGNSWTKFKESDHEYIITHVSECEDLFGYTGQIIKLGGRWPWYQTTNFVKIS